jgi:hypothetical protein
VSLQGTLDTFSLPDVLRFLAASAKTGRLVLSGTRGGGDVWLDDGAVVAAETERATSPVDAVFDLLRDDSGSFTFDADLTRSDADDPMLVDDLLIQAEARLAEWREIEAVVPSLDVAVRLSDHLPGGAVRIESSQWRAIVAVAENGTVTAVGDQLDLGEFDACRTVKELAERGLVLVGEGTEAADEASDPVVKSVSKESGPKPKNGTRATRKKVEDAPGVDDDTVSLQDDQPLMDDEMAAELEKLGPEAAKVIEEAARATTPEEREKALAGVADDDPSRGLLLKFLSSVRS